MTASPRELKRFSSRGSRALAPCSTCATLSADREALLIECERLRKDRNAAFDRVDLTHGPECGRLDRRRIEEAEAARAEACVGESRRAAERDAARAQARGFAHAADTERAEAKHWRSERDRARAALRALSSTVSELLEAPEDRSLRMRLAIALRDARAALAPPSVHGPGLAAYGGAAPVGGSEPPRPNAAQPEPNPSHRDGKDPSPRPLETDASSSDGLALNDPRDED
jgi:hypothetical protein